MFDLRGGERLEPEPYYADFEHHFASMGEPGFWKLESLQDYTEDGHDSWEAFRRGEWDESLRLLAAGRERVAEYYSRISVPSHRVRIVEEPLTPYVQWEMHALWIRQGIGDSVRVLRAPPVRLPDVMVLGTSVMYQVFCEAGPLEYALRFTDPALIRRCQAQIQDLYEAGQPLDDYFQENVAPLPPPMA